MVPLLVSVIVLHLVTLAMLFIATLHKSWWVSEDSEIIDFWYDCYHNNTTRDLDCLQRSQNFTPDWSGFFQTLLVLSVVSSSISFLLFVGQLFYMYIGGLFYFTGLCQICAGLTDFAACLIFTFRHQEIVYHALEQSTGHFGYCFILAWFSVPLLLISGVLYVHLRKKQ